jgi:uncharacterized membrane protein YidH (DUF202 family)
MPKSLAMDLGFFFTATPRLALLARGTEAQRKAKFSHKDTKTQRKTKTKTQSSLLALLALLAFLALLAAFYSPQRAQRPQRQNLTIFNTLSATSAISMVNKSYCYTVSQREGMVFPLAKILLFISSYDKIYLDIYRREFLWP